MRDTRRKAAAAVAVGAFNAAAAGRKKASPLLGKKDESLFPCKKGNNPPSLLSGSRAHTRAWER